MNMGSLPESICTFLLDYMPRDIDLTAATPVLEILLLLTLFAPFLFGVQEEQNLPSVDAEHSEQPAYRP